MGVARDNLPRDGQTYGFMAGFAEVEVDVETGVYDDRRLPGVADVGTVIHPNSLGGQIHGGGIQGIGHVRSQKLVYDPHYGAALANAHASQQAADDSRHARSTRSGPRVGIARSDQPGRRQGHRRAVRSAPAAAPCCVRWPTRSATTSSGARRCSRNRSSSVANGRGGSTYEPLHGVHLRRTRQCLRFAM